MKTIRILALIFTSILCQLHGAIIAIQQSNIAALRSINATTVTAGSQCQVQGYYVSGDGGGGLFVWSANNSNADDGGLVIAPSSGPGRWIRVYDGYVFNPKWWGAYGDHHGSSGHDDTTAINQAFTSVRNLNLLVAPTVSFPSGNYLTGTVNFTGCSISGVTSTTTIITGKPGQDVFQWSTPGTSGYTALQHANISNMTICVDASIDARGSFPNRLSFSGDAVGNCAIVYPDPNGANWNFNTVGNTLSNLYISAINSLSVNYTCAIFSDNEMYGWVYNNITIANAGTDFGIIEGAGYASGRQVTFNSGTSTVVSVSHGFTNGQQVAFSPSFFDATLPTGISTGMGFGAAGYYVINASTNSFQISLTSGGSAVAFTSNGSGHIIAVRTGSTSGLFGYSTDEMSWNAVGIHSGILGLCIVNLNNAVIGNLIIHPNNIAGEWLTYSDGQMAHSTSNIIHDLYTEGPLQNFAGTYLYFSMNSSEIRNAQAGGNGAAVISQQGNLNRFLNFQFDSADNIFTLNGNNNTVEIGTSALTDAIVTDNGFGNHILYTPAFSGASLPDALNHYASQTYNNFGSFEPDYLFGNSGSRYQSHRTLYTPGASLSASGGTAASIFLTGDSTIETAGYSRTTVASGNNTLFFSTWAGNNTAAGKFLIGNIVPATKGILYAKVRASVAMTGNIGAVYGATTAGVTAISITTSWAIYSTPYDMTAGSGQNASIGLTALVGFSGNQTVDVAWTCWVPFTVPQWSKTVEPTSTTGSVTINDNTGAVNFAASATSLVVTDSLVNVGSIITAVLATNDSTAVLGAVVASSGSFTIYMKTAPTATSRVNFSISN